jgi:hypothetical protein
MAYTRRQQAALMGVFKDHGATPQVARKAARELGIREQDAIRAANAFQEAFANGVRAFTEAGDFREVGGFTESDPDMNATGGETKHQAWMRESAARMAERANAAEAKGLRNASLQELEALAAITFGR